MPITLANALPSRLDWHRHRVAEPWPVPPPAAGCDAEFVKLQAGYRSHGGLVRAEALAACWSVAGTGGYVDLTRYQALEKVAGWVDGLSLALKPVA